MNQKSKKLFIIGLLLTFILFLFYLFAAMRPGLWYSNTGHDTFLYRTGENIYEGSLYHQNYKMTFSKEQTDTHTNARIIFSVNDESRSFYVTRNKLTQDVDIYENETLIFEGNDRSGFLFSDDFLLETSGLADVTIITDDTYPPLGDGFPSVYALHDWCLMSKPDTRGLVVMIIPILLLLAYAIADFLYPEFFFHLRYMFRFDVENPEPSDWYYTSQKIGRVVCVIGAIALAVMSFMMH